MGEDARIEDLLLEIDTAELITLKATLKLALDDPSFSAADAKKILLSTLLSSAIAASSEVDYKALTPKGFHASVATEGRKGIVELATDLEIAAETANKVLQSDDQAAMRLNWSKALSGSHTQGRPKVWQQDGIGGTSTVPLSYKFTVVFNTDKVDTTTEVHYILPFTQPTGKRIWFVLVNGMYFSSSAVAQIDNNWLTIFADKEIQFGSNTFKIVFPVNGTEPYILVSKAGLSSVVMDIMLIYR